MIPVRDVKRITSSKRVPEMNLLKDPRRLRLTVIILIIASGLSVVLCETFGGLNLPRNLILTLRTVFWTAAICYFWLRLTKRIG